MSTINHLNEAILNADKNYPDPKGKIYSPWENNFSETIGDFYTDFIEDRLPNPKVVVEWHDMLVDYSQRKEAIFPVRAGNNKKSLRRGWLVRVDDGFSYMFTDNGLASYIYKMALDGFCPKVDEFLEFMTKFVKVSDIAWLNKLNENPKKKQVLTINNVTDSETGKERHFLSMPIHFHQIGGSGIDATEDEKNAYVNTYPAPVCCLGEYNYKHAHLVGVADDVYEISGKGIFKFKDIKQALLGDVTDYQWKDDICNYAWDRDLSNYNGKIPFSIIEEIIKAQFFRFLDPLNHFLAPKEQQNKYTNSDGYPSLDIAEYKNLLKYLLEQKKINHPTIFNEFKDRAAVPNVILADDIDRISAEPIRVVYHEKSLSEATYGDKVKLPKAKTTTGTSYAKASAKVTVVSDWAAFDEYSPSGYSTYIRKIMKELSIATICELESRIDEMIDYCVNEMELAKKSGDRQRKKDHSNYRSALRKYKEFMDSKKILPWC